MDYLYFIVFGFGLIVGVISSLLFLSSSKSGTLRVYDSDIDDETYLFLELNKAVHKSVSKKYVIFKVKK